MRNLYLLARMADTDIAVPSSLIESVVRVTHVVPVPSAPPHVAGLFALRSAVVTVIDCQYAITGQGRAVEKDHMAFVANIDGHAYALLMDHIEDVVTLDADTIEKDGRLDPAWRAVARGTVEVGERTVVVIDPVVLVEGERKRAA